MKKDEIFDEETVAKVDAKNPGRGGNKSKDAMKRILSGKIELGKTTVHELINEGRRY
jgi:hypothetical protein